MAALFKPEVGGRELRDYQIETIEQLRDSLRAGKKRPMVQAPTAWGKCLGRGTPVMLWSGKVLPVEQIRTGDWLMGPDSQPRAVLSTCHGTDPLYRITPTKGDPYVVNEAHILSLVMTGGSQADVPNPGRDGGLQDGEVVNIAVGDYLKRSATFRHCAKGYRAAVDFPYQELTNSLHPYFLGLWLGDGSSKSPEICSGDEEIVSWLRVYAEDYGMLLSERSNSAKSQMYYLGTGYGPPNPLLETMRQLELIKNKHIPHVFKTGTRHYRLQLLAGLVDTDGYLNGACTYDFTLKDERLVDDIIFVARSLGFASYKYPVQKTCTNNGAVGTYWRFTISGEISRIPCRVERKKAAPRRTKKNPLHVGIEVTPIGEGEYFGFELEGDGLFLLGDFTVTHNTRFAGELLRLAREKGYRVIFCVPRIDLIDQTLVSFWADGLDDIGVIQANHPETDWSRPVQIASVQTLIKRGFPEAGLVIVDEAHMAFEKVHEWMAKPEWAKVPFIGLSATPWTKGLGKHYDDLVIAGTTQDMIASGHLSNFKVFAPSHPDLKGVRTRMGDYVESDLSKAMDKPKLVADVVDTWLRQGQGRATLCFGVDRAHAKSMQQAFEASGVPCGYQDAFTKPDERAEIRRKFHNGELNVVCNVGTLTTGVDWDVRCIILARPTKSEILYTQIVGRGLRTAPGKDHCLILDHSDTTLKLGFVTDIYHDQLDDGRERKSDSVKAATPKECPRCHALRPPRVSACPACGFKPEVQAKAPQVLEGQLNELTRQGGTKKIGGGKIEFGHASIPLADFYGQLKFYGRLRGYKDGWAAMKYKAAVGTWPNAYRSAPEMRPVIAVESWIRAQQIRFAKGRSTFSPYSRPSGSVRWNS